MDPSTYLRAERGRIAEVAKTVGIAPAFLTQIASGHRPAPAVYVPALEIACRREVRRWDWRPNDWHLIWPELIGAEGAPPITEPAAACAAGG